MPKPYSQDLRDRVIDAVERGKMSRRAAARRYEISESVAIKWLERVERHGSREPVGHGGHRALTLEAGILVPGFVPEWWKFGAHEEIRTLVSAFEARWGVRHPEICINRRRLKQRNDWRLVRNRACVCSSAGRN
jgi:hypothetical protein